MTIFLFGVSNVGKSTVGSLLAHKLGYHFYDLDEEVKKYYDMSLEDFVNTGTLEERDGMRGTVIDMVMERGEDKVFAISPIAYPENFEHHLQSNDVLAIDLLDTPEHIFERLVFSNENDEIYEDNEYKNAHRDYYLTEIQEDILFYERSYSKVTNKFLMNNDTAEIVVDRMVEEYHLDVLR